MALSPEHPYPHEKNHGELSLPKVGEYSLTVPFITLFGPTGSGKSTLAQAIGKLYCADNIDIGAITRERIGVDIDFTQRNENIDIANDTNMIEAFLDASPQRPVIVVGHLGGIFANQVNWYRRNHNLPEGIGVLVWVQEDEGVKRAMKRQNEKRMANGQEPYIFEQAIKQSRHRREGDLMHWKDMYSFGDIDPFKPSEIDRNGIPLAKIAIDTTQRSEEETLLHFHENLVKLDAVKRNKDAYFKNQKNEENLPRQI